MNLLEAIVYFCNDLMGEIMATEMAHLHDVC